MSQNAFSNNFDELKGLAWRWLVESGGYNGFPDRDVVAKLGRPVGAGVCCRRPTDGCAHPPELLSQERRCRFVTLYRIKPAEVVLTPREAAVIGNYVYFDGGEISQLLDGKVPAKQNYGSNSGQTTMSYLLGVKVHWTDMECLDSRLE